MNFSRILIIVVSLLLFQGSSQSAWAQVASSFEQLQVLVKPNDTVLVFDFSGNQTKGTVGAISASSLRIVVNGVPRDLTPADVFEIRQRRSDSLATGATIGAIAGGGMGLLGAILICSMEQNCPLEAAAVVGLYTAFGAGIGVGIDALIVRQQAVYRAPARASMRFRVAPLLSGGRKGVSFSLTF